MERNKSSILVATQMKFNCKRNQTQKKKEVRLKKYTLYDSASKKF